MRSRSLKLIKRLLKATWTFFVDENVPTAWILCVTVLIPPMMIGTLLMMFGVPFIPSVIASYVIFYGLMIVEKFFKRKGLPHGNLLPRNNENPKT